MKTSWRAPAASASSAAYWISGLSTIGSISFGLALVAGRKRVPRPATGKTAKRMGAGRLTVLLPDPARHDTGAARGRPAPRAASCLSPTTSPPRTQVRLVLVDELLAEALDLREVVRALERPVLLAVATIASAFALPTPSSSRASVLASAVLMLTGPAMAVDASSIAATMAAPSPLVNMASLPFFSRGDHRRARSETRRAARGTRAARQSRAFAEK